MTSRLPEYVAGLSIALSPAMVFILVYLACALAL